MTHEEMVEYLEAVLAALQFFQPPDLYIDLHVLQALKDVLAALESEKPLAVVEGWMTPVHFCGNKRLRRGENLSGLVSGDKGETRRPVTVVVYERKPDGDS